MRSAKYTNHLGITVKFNEAGSPYTLNPFNLRAYDTAAYVMGDRIAGFPKSGIKNIGVEIGVVGQSAAQTAENYDYIAALFESDVLEVKPGTLEINGYSLECYISGLTPQRSLRKGKEAIAAVITDNRLWYREMFTQMFTASSSIILDGTTPEYDTLRYPHDYPYGYPSGSYVKQVENPALQPSHFRLIIEGPTDAPTVLIAGHTYSVDVSVPKGSKLIIDSRAATATLISADRTKVNVFDKRNRASDIFEKIPAGLSQVSFSSMIEKFYLTLIDERSYPKWRD